MIKSIKEKGRCLSAIDFFICSSRICMQNMSFPKPLGYRGFRVFRDFFIILANSEKAIFSGGRIRTDNLSWTEIRDNKLSLHRKKSSSHCSPQLSSSTALKTKLYPRPDSDWNLRR